MKNINEILFEYYDKILTQFNVSGTLKVNDDNRRLSYVWTGAGTTSAPDPSTFPDFTVGANSDGASTGLTYHVISGAWVPTGGTVANLYGA